jgi:transposase
MGRPVRPSQAMQNRLQKNALEVQREMTGMKKSSDTLAGMGTKGSDIRVAIDLSDQQSRWEARDLCTGEVRRGVLEMTPAGLERCFAGAEPCTVVMEAGTHSHWLCLQLRSMGHRAEVLPPDVLRQGSGKRRRRNDAKDAAELLEHAVDIDRPREKKLWQRPDEYQRDLALMRMRNAMVQARAGLVSTVRGTVKQFGERVSKCDVEYFAARARAELSAGVLALVELVLGQIDELNKVVAQYDAQIKAYLARRPESARLLAVPGVGEVTVGVLMASVGEASRFVHSREVAAYYGLVPGQDQSGKHDPQLRITKAGEVLGRRCFLECARSIMGPRGKDSELRRWALALAGDGRNKIRNNKAAVALARKLVVLLHRLWVTGAEYDPWYGTKRAAARSDGMKAT